MATIDEIFAAMPEEAAETGREYLVIDPETRSITVPESERIFGVTGDELADRKYFMCPRYVGDGLDLAGMFLTVYFRTATEYEDGYLVDDVAVNGEYVTFSWLLSSSVTEYKGTVQFTVCADLPNTAEKRRPDWNTTTASGEVLEGLDPDVGDVVAETSDVVAQLREMVTAQTAAVETTGAAQVDVVKAQGTNTTQEAVAAIQAQGEATRASIPADYTALAANVDRLTRDRAAVIVCEAAGASIQVQDASNDPLQGLRIFGRSTQDGTPTPEAPVEIVSTPAPVVTVCGKNLLPDEPIPESSAGSGINCKYEGNGIFHIYGTHTGQTKEIQLSTAPLSLPVDTEKRYTLAVKLLEGTAAAKFHFFLGLKSAAVSFQNWFSVPMEAGTAAGTLVHDAQYPKTELGDNIQISRFWIYSYNPNLTAYTIDMRVQIWLEQGDAPTAYEPYTGQALTITTPGSLPGIPVASGGNYTDAAGQQWIADEVDLARGVYVQRVKKFVLADLKTETWYTWGVDHSTAGFTGFYHYFTDDVTNDMVMSNIGVYSKTAWGGVGAGVSASADGNYFMVSVANANLSDVTTDEKATESFISLLEETDAYIMAAIAPVETPLSDVELQAFLAMHSNKPTTTVLNDAGAHMVLEYAADPKTYIDNKLAALTAANS